MFLRKCSEMGFFVIQKVRKSSHSINLFPYFFFYDIIKLMNKREEKTSQEVQDDIFRRMSADKKIELGSQLWQLGKDLVGDKINYGRSQTSFNKNRRDSK